MTASFSLEDIRRSMPGEYLARGRDYLTEGRVSRFAHPEQNHYQALVLGSRAQPYDVDVRLVRGKTGKQIYGLCSCPMRVNCKHVAAVLLRALQGPPDVSRHALPATTGERVRALERLDARPATLPREFRDWLERTRGTLAPAPVTPDEYPPGVIHRLLYLLASRPTRKQASSRRCS